MSAERQSALIVPAPEADPFVDHWRVSHDVAAAAGVPAHLTLIYPFRAALGIDASLLAELGDFFAKRPPFRYRLAGLCAFARILYLAPDPARPFVELTRALAARYPEHPPYGGTHREIIPHLTVAQPEDVFDVGPIAREILAAAEDRLPIDCFAREAWLMVEGDNRRWSVGERFTLGIAP